MFKLIIAAGLFGLMAFVILYGVSADPYLSVPLSGVIGGVLAKLLLQ